TPIRSAPAVMPTSPARTPLSTIVKSMVLNKICEVKNAATAPAHAATAVVTITRDTNPGSADNTEPPLKPNHPNHKRKTPMVANGRLWPGIAFVFPSTYLPSLGPSKITQANAAHPPTLSTSVDPAKS